MSETWLEIKDEIKSECRIEDEDFVTSNDLLKEANRIIDEIKPKIVALREGNFKTIAPLTMIAGSNDVTLPNNLFHAKIELLWCFDPAASSGGYEVKRIKDRREAYSMNQSQNEQLRYKYEFLTGINGEKIIKIYPKARQTSSTLLELTYIRTIRKITGDSDIVDLAEFTTYFKEALKEYVYKTEEDWTKKQECKSKKEEILNDIIIATSPSTDDSCNEIEVDTSFYHDHV